MFTAKNNLVLARAAQRKYDLPVVQMTQTERAELLYTMALAAIKQGDVDRRQGPSASRPSKPIPQHFEAAARSLAALDANVTPADAAIRLAALILAGPCRCPSRSGRRWSDMKRMKIPNKAVLALAAVWPLLGLAGWCRWTAWLWGFALMAIVLVMRASCVSRPALFGRGRRQICRRDGAVLRRGRHRLVMLLIAACLIGAPCHPPASCAPSPPSAARRRTGKAGRSGAISRWALRCRASWSSIFLPPSGRKSDTSARLTTQNRSPLRYDCPRSLSNER